MSGVVTVGLEQPPKISDPRTLGLVAQLLLAKPSEQEEGDGDPE